MKVIKFEILINRKRQGKGKNFCSRAVSESIFCLKNKDLLRQKIKIFKSVALKHRSAATEIFLIQFQIKKKK